MRWKVANKLFIMCSELESAFWIWFNEVREFETTCGRIILACWAIWCPFDVHLVSISLHLARAMHLETGVRFKFERRLWWGVSITSCTVCCYVSADHQFCQGHGLLQQQLINCFESIGNLKFFGWWSDEDAELVEVIAHEEFGSEHRLFWRVIKIIWVNCKWSENISVSRPWQSLVSEWLRFQQ